MDSRLVFTTGTAPWAVFCHGQQNSHSTIASTKALKTYIHGGCCLKGRLCVEQQPLLGGQGGGMASLSSSPCSPYVSDTLESNGSSKPVLQSCVVSGWLLPSSFLCVSPFCGSRGPALHLGSSKTQFSLCGCELLVRRTSSSFLLY